MKLGLWNRLAIVAILLALLIAPVAIQMNIARESNLRRDTLYDICIKYADKAPLPKLMEEHAKCIDDRFPTPDPYTPWTWKNWREFAGGTLAFCAIFYVLIWVIVATVKWVWRGRSRTT